MERRTRRDGWRDYGHSRESFISRERQAVAGYTMGILPEARATSVTLINLKA